jgi:hypothetical protein
MKMAIADYYNFVDSTLGTFDVTQVESLDSQNRKFRVYITPSLFGKLKIGTEVIFGTPSELPPGLTVDTLNGELTGQIPYQPRITKEYKFTITASALYNGEVKASTPRTFNIKIVGEIESGLEWISDQDLGSIAPNINSTLYIEAMSKLRGGTTIFLLQGGELPPGLTLLTSGEIIGKVNQIGNDQLLGITRFFNDTGSGQDFTTTTYDSDLTTFDREYVFTVSARDIFNYTESIRTFKITVNTAADISYSNMYFKVLQKKNLRKKFNNFISDIDIFEPQKIYRYGDPSYGVQQEMKMLMYAGVESVAAIEFVQAMSRNHYNKRLTFGDIRKASAKNTITQEVEYEVVYVDVVDQYEKNGKSISKVVNLPDKINSPILVSGNTITVDTDIPYVSDKDHQRIFPNSIKNMRDRIKKMEINEDDSTVRRVRRDRTFLPLWMRSIQSDSFVEPGFVSAMPVCYCKPGLADDIILNIKNSGFDFKTMNFEVDRYQIDNIDGVSGDKYLVFPQRGEKV